MPVLNREDAADVEIRSLGFSQHQTTKDLID